MAGPTLGAFSPASHICAALRRVPHQPKTTRTRRTHGVCLLGAELATVTSSRREGEARGVELKLAGDSLTLCSRMTSTQARAMARALVAAAIAAEGLQQCAARQCLEGGAA